MRESKRRMNGSRWGWGNERMCKKLGSLRTTSQLSPQPAHTPADVLFFLPFLIMRASSFLMLIANRLIKAKLKATPWVLLCCKKNTSWLPWCFFLIFFFGICVRIQFSSPFFLFFYTPIVPNLQHSFIYTLTHVRTRSAAHTTGSLSLNFITRRLANIYIRVYEREWCKARVMNDLCVCICVCGEGVTTVRGRRRRKEGSRMNRRRCTKTKNWRRWQG